jgi:hypothetical protein
MSRDVPADTGLLSDKAVVQKDMTNVVLIALK